MPKLMYGDMIKKQAGKEPIFFTANSVINSRGQLVMGAGIAKQVQDKYPSLPSVLGSAICNGRNTDGDYFIVYAKAYKVGALQVKRHFSKPADLHLIEASLIHLEWWAHGKDVHINMPGVGLGGLELKQVMPLVLRLPDNIHVWQKLW